MMTPIAYCSLGMMFFLPPWANWNLPRPLSSSSSSSPSSSVAKKILLSIFVTPSSQVDWVSVSPPLCNESNKQSSFARTHVWYSHFSGSPSRKSASSLVPVDLYQLVTSRYKKKENKVLPNNPAEPQEGEHWGAGACFLLNSWHFWPRSYTAWNLYSSSKQQRATKVVHH